MRGNVVPQERVSKEEFIFSWRKQTSGLDVSNILTDSIGHDVGILTDFGSVKQQVRSNGRPSISTRPSDMVVFLLRCEEPFPEGRGKTENVLTYLGLSSILIFQPLALEFWVSVLKHRYHHNYVQYTYIWFSLVSLSVFICFREAEWEERFLLTFRVTLLFLISGPRHERSVALETVSILGMSSWVTDVIWMGQRHWDTRTSILSRGIVKQDCVAMIHIPEVLGSIVGRNTKYCDLHFCNFPQFPLANVQLLIRPLLFKVFPIHDSSVILPSYAVQDVKKELQL
jgi:hypothetical protein